MNLFLQKMNVVRDLKEFLNEQGFQEVLTPVLRKNHGTLIPRIQLINGQALRDSHELQLRYLLSEYNSIYEIGSCFREESEENTSTNSREFLLMELFTSKHSLLDLKELTKQFLLRQKPDTVFYEISIAECIKNQFNIDLFHEDQEILIRKLKKIYPHENFLYDYEYVLHYIKKEIEPLSQGKVVFLIDYPECTCSYAKIKKGNIISRFELFADGLELANGFDDECSPESFIARNECLPIFQNEEETIVKCLSSSLLPANSAGVGIGIERLCMFLFESDEITDFAFPSKAF